MRIKSLFFAGILMMAPATAHAQLLQDLSPIPRLSGVDLPPAPPRTPLRPSQPALAGHSQLPHLIFLPRIFAPERSRLWSPRPLDQHPSALPRVAEPTPDRFERRTAEVVGEGLSSAKPDPPRVNSDSVPARRPD